MSPANIDVLGLSAQLKVGDVIFIRVPALPFKKIASTTASWTNHVGIVVDVGAFEPVIAESRFPVSGVTRLSSFIARSENGRVAVKRLKQEITEQQRHGVLHAARGRSRIFYDTGFDFHSRRQFCSRFVHEVLEEATGIRVGEIEHFFDLFARNPDADIKFWRLWYFGRIPWRRETITPASLMRCSNIHFIFDG